MYNVQDGVNAESVIAAKKYEEMMKMHYENNNATAEDYVRAIDFSVQVQNARITVGVPAGLEAIVQLMNQRFNELNQNLDRRFDEVDRRFDEVDRRFNNLENQIAQQNRTTTIEYRKNSTGGSFDESLVYFFPSLVENQHLPERLPQNRRELFGLNGAECGAIERAYGITYNRGDRVLQRRERIANFIGVLV